MFLETGLAANMFFTSNAMLISILSSGPCRLAMKEYVARRSMDKIYQSSIHLIGTRNHFQKEYFSHFKKKKNLLLKILLTQTLIRISMGNDNLDRSSILNTLISKKLGICFNTPLLEKNYLSSVYIKRINRYSPLPLLQKKKSPLPNIEIYLR